VRASWDETWLKVAVSLSQRSACTNRQVGAVVVDANNRPVSVGYNGSPSGLPTTGSCANFCHRSGSENRGGQYGNCVSVHAEANALIFADRRHYEGGTIYVTNPCCWDCSKLIANSGLVRVVMMAGEQDAHADWRRCVDFIRACGLSVEVKGEKE